jgi:hypothetical protein
VYAQRFSAAGAKVGGEFRVNQATAASQRPSGIAMDGQGNFVVGWSTSDGLTNTPGFAYDAYARWYAVDGTPLTGDVVVSATTAGRQEGTLVGRDRDGNTLIAWSSDQDGTTDVFGRAFGPDGVPQGGEFRVNTATAGIQGVGRFYGGVAAQQGGRFIVTYGTEVDGGAEVLFQRYDPEAAVAPNGGTSVFGGTSITDPMATDGDLDVLLT